MPRPTQRRVNRHSASNCSDVTDGGHVVEDAWRRRRRPAVCGEFTVEQGWSIPCAIEQTGQSRGDSLCCPSVRLALACFEDQTANRTGTSDDACISDQQSRRPDRKVQGEGRDKAQEIRERGAACERHSDVPGPADSNFAGRGGRRTRAERRHLGRLGRRCAGALRNRRERRRTWRQSPRIGLYGRPGRSRLWRPLPGHHGPGVRTRRALCRRRVPHVESLPRQRHRGRGDGVHRPARRTGAHDPHERSQGTGRLSGARAPERAFDGNRRGERAGIREPEHCRCDRRGAQTQSCIPGPSHRSSCGRGAPGDAVGATGIFDRVLHRGCRERRARSKRMPRTADSWCLPCRRA